MSKHERVRGEPSIRDAIEEAAYDVLESERDFLKKANAALAVAYQSIADENAELRARCDELDKFNLSLATESHTFRTALEEIADRNGWAKKYPNFEYHYIAVSCIGIARKALGQIT